MKKRFIINKIPKKIEILLLKSIKKDSFKNSNLIGINFEDLSIFFLKKKNTV